MSAIPRLYAPRRSSLPASSCGRRDRGRGGSGATGEATQQTAEQTAVGVGFDRQNDPIQVDDETEQFEVERPQRQAENVADARRRLRAPHRRGSPGLVNAHDVAANGLTDE
jgi:hypothetical protein